MNVEMILFLVVAAVAVLSALMMITRRNPVQSVLFLIVNFFCLAVLYLVLHAQFIAVIQILVYAGAIMVLFLFVIMLLNVGDEHAPPNGPFRRKILGFVLAAVVLVQILLGTQMPAGVVPSGLSKAAAEMGTVEFVGRSLYTDYLLPFEITSLVLLAAMVGVLVLAKKNFR
jgi:NADH-quinone oxidoreductase subunit J